MPRSKKTLANVGASTKPEELSAHDKQRTEQVVKRFESAMTRIRAEIEASEMIYPENKGRLTQAEVCRRAGFGKGVLQGPKHKTTTKTTVDEFVSQMLVLMAGNGASARRLVSARANEWKDRHEKVARTCHLYVLRLEDALKRNRELEVENETLKQQINLVSNLNIKTLKQVKKADVKKEE